MSTQKYETIKQAQLYTWNITLVVFGNMYLEFKNTDKWNVSADLCQHLRAKYLGINALKKHYQRGKIKEDKI
jgi:hypothetical protein